MKFKIGQEVILLNQIVNSERQDTYAYVDRILTSAKDSGKILVLCNGTYLKVSENRLVDPTEYYANKRKETKDGHK